MNLKKLFSPGFWKYDYKKFRELYDYDLRFNASFRGKAKLSRRDRKKYEIRYLYLYRRCQVANGTIWHHLFFPPLRRFSLKTGIGICENMHLSRGLIIGHYGRVVINGKVIFGEQIYLTHGVTIGQNSTGRRKGVPQIGNRVRVGANACIVGNVRVGNDVIIAPNAFVNVDIPDHSVVIGNPCVIHYKERATDGYLGTMN